MEPGDKMLRTSASVHFAVASIALAILAACGTSNDETAPAITPTNLSSPSLPPSSSPSPTTAPTPTSGPATPDGPLRLGQAADLTLVKITVHGYREGASSDRALKLEKSEKWASIDVRLCNTSSDVIQAKHDFWTLQSADSMEYEKANFQDFGMPQQPVYGGRDVQPSKCTRGWISFVVPRSESPVLAVYNNESHRFEWAVVK